MQLTKIVKWRESRTGNCPAIYADTDSGDLVIQGWEIGKGDLAQLEDRAGNETAVRIPRSLIEDYLAARG